MYVGVRAGGGIGDEIEDPAGDEYELYRVVFDITFFFFVIVILLAIIQGRRQLQRCTQELNTSLFVHPFFVLENRFLENDKVQMFSEKKFWKKVLKG